MVNNNEPTVSWAKKQWKEGRTTSIRKTGNCKKQKATIKQTKTKMRKQIKKDAKTKKQHQNDSPDDRNRLEQVFGGRKKNKKNNQPHPEKESALKKRLM